jgi:hypothetical protein
MHFQTIFTIPLLFIGAFAAPTEGDTLIKRTDLSPGQTGATDKICILKKCIGGAGGGPKCNIDRKNNHKNHCSTTVLTLFEKNALLLPEEP